MPSTTNEEQLDVTLATEKDNLEPVLALCLSGGGYRAMVFHIGAILRLNEMGWLKQMEYISSVSGGSITAGVLAMNWSKLKWSNVLGKEVASNLNECLVDPLRRMAKVTIDVGSIVWGSLNPFQSISDQIAAAYDEHLFSRLTLQSLPDAPRFIINSTNVKTGALWRFTKSYMGDWRTGLIRNPEVPLARVVAASSAFPPFLSPAILSLDPRSFDQDIKAEFSTDDFRKEIVLTDGGVYDNLGLEPVLKRSKRILVSDGGRPMAPDPNPARDWAQHSRRLIDLLERQVTSLRRREIVQMFKDKVREGCYWGIRTDIKEYELADALPLLSSQGDIVPSPPPVSDYPTRLEAMTDEVQLKLINWGYTICDTAVRKYFDPEAIRPAQIPYPASGY